MAFVLVVLAFTWTFSAELDQAHREAITRHRVNAVLMTSSGFQAIPGKGGTEGLNKSTKAQIAWKAPDGTRRTAEAPVPQDQKAGTHITVWVDASGALTAEPAGEADAFCVALAVASLVGLGLLAGRRSCRMARRYWLARRAVAGIDREWELTAARWTGRAA